MLKAKIVQNWISYEKLSGRISQSLPGVELGSSKDHTQEVLTQTDKPLPVIVFTLATNSAERTENVTVCTVKYYTNKSTVLSE